MSDDPGDHDAGSVLASYWAAVVAETDDDEDDETLAPFSAAWPGLAQAGITETDPDVRAAEVAAGLIEQGWLSSPRLVRARRSPARRAGSPPARPWPVRARSAGADVVGAGRS